MREKCLLYVSLRARKLVLVSKPVCLNNQGETDRLVGMAYISAQVRVQKTLIKVVK